MPAVAQTIIAQVRAAVVDPPKEVGNFDWLGTTTLDGREYLTYRSVEKQADAGAATGAPVLHRTIYIDSKTGWPASNIVSADPPSSEVVFKATYDYPARCRSRTTRMRPGENEIGAALAFRAGSRIEDE